MEDLPAHTLLDVPWEDVIFKILFPKLSLTDLCNLRDTSQSYKFLVETYLNSQKEIDLSENNIDNTVFKVLADVCTNIRTVNFTYCDWIDNKLLQQFFVNNPDITDANLSKISFNINKYLHSLVSSCKNLEKLNLHGCRNLTVGAVETLIYSQNNINFLDIGRCVLLSEMTLKKLVIKFYNIKSLSLVGIPAVNYMVILTIKKHCNNLEFLNLDNCGVSFRSVCKLIQSKPKLESVKICRHLVTKAVVHKIATNEQTFGVVLDF